MPGPLKGVGQHKKTPSVRVVFFLLSVQIIVIL